MEPGRPLWNKLPVEICLMILDQLVLAEQQDGGSVAPYAAVCSEWQAVIEPITFRSIKFTPSLLQIPGFASMANRARDLDLVRRIDLFIPLAEYGCFECRDAVEEEEWTANRQTTRSALNAVLSFLSTWKPNGSLSLDITVQSPSDPNHWFKHVDLDNHRQNTVVAAHDPRHGWEHGSRVALPQEEAIFRLFGDIELLPEHWQELPQVTAVTNLYLRRQTTRRWEPGGIQELVKRLVGLKELHYEPWREWNLWDTATTDASTQRLFESLHLVGPGLSRIVLFEDFSDAYITEFRQPTFMGGNPWLLAEPVRTASDAVSRELAVVSAKLLHLEHLSASFLIDARHFLPALLSPSASIGTGSWSKLASITLTSQLLTPSSSGSVVNELLEVAATAASRLPALDSMRLWNGGKEVACVFRYQAPSSLASPRNGDQQVSSAEITWRATWDLSLEARVIAEWERTACKRGPCRVHVVHEILDASVARTIQSHGDAVNHLEFLDNIVHPVSLSQIQRENRY